MTASQTDPEPTLPTVAAIRRTPSVPTLYAVDLNWLIDEYIGWRRTQLANQKTVDCYGCKLRWFRDWWEEVGPGQEWLLRQADLGCFERYLREVVSQRTKRRLAYLTRNDIMQRLREMFHWACNKDYTEKDYAAWVPKADGGPSKRRAAGIAALTRLLAEAGNSRQPSRDRAIIAMMMGMGLRRIEIVNLNVEDVVIEGDLSGYAHVVGKRTAANKTGKRDAAFDAATGKIVTAHLDAMAYGPGATCGANSLPRGGRGGVSVGPMFRNPTNGRLTTQGVYQVVKKTIKRAGLEDEIQACHDLRRSFTTYVARNRRGTDAADRLRRQLGHAKYSQTADYALLDVEDLRVDFISPLGIMSPEDIYRDIFRDTLGDPARASIDG